LPTGNRTAAAAKKKQDNSEINDGNVQSPDEMAQCESNTNGDTYSENRAMHNVSADKGMQIDVDYTA
jgi:hypothetical protein